MIEKIFPYKIHLNILQLEGYEISRFWTWILSNFLKRDLEGKKQLVWTNKAKLILRVSIISALVLTGIFYQIFGNYGLLFGFLLSTQSYIYLSMAIVLIKPYEILNKYLVKNKTRQKIKSFKNLKVIGVTGSYGKTSIKEFLYFILKSQYKVLKTPESYNTLFGISKVVDYELDDNYDFFICEMGAYTIGEIKELCEMTSPNFGILSGINEQHLERFGSIENTTKAKFELVEAVPSDGFSIVNIDNEIVKDNYIKYQGKIIAYGFSNSEFSVRNITLSKGVTNFDLVLDSKAHKVKTNLIGNSNLSNILAASTMSFLLGVKPEKIVEQIGLLKSVAHRLEISENKENDATIIDDAYNSNPTGFREAINTLNLFENRPKVLVTPGIVELGNKTKETHVELGGIADSICDYIFLVGRNERTISIEAGVKNKKKVIYIEKINLLWQEVKKLNLNHPVVLLENDLPDNY